MTLDAAQRQRLFQIADGFVGREPDNHDQAVFSRAWNLECAVNNGGFLAYFGGYAGGDATQAVHDLRTLGAAQMADIVAAAVKLVGALPSDQDARIEVVDAFDQDFLGRLEDLDAAFMAYPDGDTEPFYMAWIDGRSASFSSL